MGDDRRTIVVFYNARHSLPLRSSNEAHVYSWGRYSKHHVLYINVGYGVPWRVLDRLDIDAIVFDTIFLSMHWDPGLFAFRAGPCLRLRDRDCPKIAVVQDEFMNMNIVVPFLEAVGITHVLSCAEPADWPTIYPGLDPGRVGFRTALTGYADENRLERIARMPRPPRDIDIGYRAWNNPHWLGEYGTHKVRIGQEVGAAARRRGLRVDINAVDAKDFLIGDRWFEFLLRCRAVLGVEGGASLCDWDGSVRARVEAHLRAHPDATFEETRAACFPDQDHAIDLACLSPRHFEACMTRTCQVLLEGRYNGIFEPWRHYIPVRKDYSNLDEVLDALADEALTARIAEQAYEDIIASGRWSYRAFIGDLERTIIEPAPPSPRAHGALTNAAARLLLRLREATVLRFAHVEAATGGTAPSAVDRYLLAEGRRILDLQ